MTSLYQANHQDLSFPRISEPCQVLAAFDIIKGQPKEEHPYRNEKGSSITKDIKNK